MGWRFEIERPPVVEINTPVLLNHQPGQFSAQPFGTCGGPLAGGAVQIQGAPQILPPAFAPAPPAALSLTPPAPAALLPPAPAVNAPRLLTCEEWCAVMRQAQSAPLALPVPPPPPGVRESKPCP